MIAIIDYGAGNMRAIQNMLKRIGRESIITSETDAIRRAEKLILPGVGSFDHGMKNLHQTGLVSVLQDEVQSRKKPILGICLGAHLFTERSEEGEMEGLGFLEAQTVRFGAVEGLRVPHMGWANVECKKQSLLTRSFPADARFYFAHSYHLKEKNEADVLLSANYGYPFCAAMEKENVFCVQFHPEKSHRFGMKLLQNFADLS